MTAPEMLIVSETCRLCLKTWTVWVTDTPENRLARYSACKECLEALFGEKGQEDTQ